MWNRILIFFCNLVKVILINLADIINFIWNPFDNFTRPLVTKYQESLANKATQFENALGQFYHDGIVYDSTISWGVNFDDVGDEALFHGMTVAMWCIKYSVTKDPSDLEKIRQGMVGLNLHQTAHGEPIRRLIRGISNPLDPKNTFIDDVSNDGATGHLLGIYYAWKYGDTDIKQKANVLIRGLADELLNNNYCLVGPTGSPTTYGTLIDGWKTNSMRLTLCMAILRVAALVTQDSKYWKAFSDVSDIYGSVGLFKYPKVSLLIWNNWNDDHRAAIHLSILADTACCEAHKKEFTDGLKRIWRLNKNSGNAWIAYLCGQHFTISKEELQPCVTLLNEFYVEDENNLQKINSLNPQVEKLGIEMKEYSIAEFIQGDLVSTQPLPLWWTGSQEFRWQRCLYSVNDWIGITTPTQIFFGLDFLLGYWSFRQLGYISDKE